MAYVQFLAHFEEIKTLLAQGHSKKIVHERLTEQKLISMAYVTFCQILQKEIKNDARAPKEQKQTSSQQQPASKPLPLSGPRIVNTAKEPFPDPRKMSLEDGI